MILLRNSAMMKDLKIRAIGFIKSKPQAFYEYPNSYLKFCLHIGLATANMLIEDLVNEGVLESSTDSEGMQHYRLKEIVSL